MKGWKGGRKEEARVEGRKEARVETERIKTKKNVMTEDGNFGRVLLNM